MGLFRKKCEHNMYFCADTHIANHFIEIAQYKNELEILMYDCRHNEEGGHNGTRSVIKLNYCPKCGKKLKWGF